MPSRKLILEKDNYYHIYNRWFDKQIIFRSDDDFERFYKTIIRYNKIYKWIKILAYCFLSNHFHIIITSNESGIEITNFMRKIQQSYAMYFKTNLSADLKNKWPVFEWRFKSKLINTDEYLEQCLAYISFNPVKHQIVDNIDDYKWTSYHQINKKRLEKYKDYILEELEF